jgi:FkbM family methyltransferase
MRTLPRLGSRLVEARQTIRAWARVRGLEVGRAHPDMSLAHFLPKILTRYDIEYVLDVGAHHGEFARILRRHGYSGYIVSFEPVWEHFSELSRRASGDPKWMVHHMALGSENSTLQINVARGGSGCSSFLNPSEYGRYATDGRVLSDHSEDVEVRRLDCIASEIFPTAPAQNVYLKLDTQGYDLEVIKGAGHILKSIPALQSEMSIQPIYDGMPGFAESIGMLNEYGYDISAMFPVKRDDGLRLVEFDCIVVRGEAPTAATGPRRQSALVR